MLEYSTSVATGGRGTGGGLGNQGGVIVSKDNRWLVAVDAGSDEISVFAIGEHGLRLTDRDRSDGDRPVSVTMQGDIVYVLNAGSDSISGFVLNQRGRLGAPEPTNQSAACWVAITLDNRYAYTTNTGSDTISGFRLRSDGGIEPLNGNSIVASVAPGAAPIDMGITDDNRFLYVLNGGTQSVDGFRIGTGGELIALDTLGGLPAGVNGLAVR